MILILLMAGLVVFGLLLLVTALRPARSALSDYELNRRSEAGDNIATAALRRKKLFSEFGTLKEPLSAILLVVFTLLMITALGWQRGVVIVIVATLLYSKLAHTSFMQRIAKKIFHPYEKKVLNLLDRHQGKLRIVSGRQAEQWAIPFGSPEELLHLIAESGTVLSPDDKKLLAHALVFTKRRASAVMTAREDIVSVGHTELLGPLVLSDLHKTGHTCFPIIAGDLDHIVGMLDIRDLLTLEAKRSLTAAKAMTSRAFFVRGDQTLDQALAAFVRTRHHLLVVVDAEGVTLGLLSLRDVLESLFGRPMADEFASDSDLHLVAKRQL